MDINSALKKLYSLHQFGIKLGLENTFELLEEVGNPHLQLKCFHIAGSNGKGSTASFIASILMEMGYKVGLYTSPHFVRFNERIRINGKEISDEYIAQFVSGLDSYIDKKSPTFFELTTALAFKYFSEEKVDYVVLETGLGGRLDSTSVIMPIASIITTISLEHTNILGDTIEKIAYEKAGIIKKNVPIFIGLLNPKAESVIREIADERASSFFTSKDFTELTSEYIKVNLRNSNFTIYETPLQGDHQLKNAALAVKTVAEVMDVKNPLLLSRGIRNVVSNSKIEGRYEVISREPRIIVDSAHNPEGIESFCKEFLKEWSLYKNTSLIFGVMRDKDYKKMIEMVFPLFNQKYFLNIAYERAASFNEIETTAKEFGYTIECLEEPITFIDNFRQSSTDDCLVILGSMYLLGEIKSKNFGFRT